MVVMTTICAEITQTVTLGIIITILMPTRMMNVQKVLTLFPQEDHLVANSDLPELTKLQEKLNLADFQKFPPLKVLHGVERG